MTKNVGKIDKVGRIVMAIIFVVLYMTGQVSGILGWSLLGLAAIFAITSLINFCPLYAIFGINTCPLDDKK